MSHDFIIPLHITVDHPDALDDVASEIENGLQDGVDSGPLSKETTWDLGEAIPAGPYASLVEKAKSANSIKLTDGMRWEVVSSDATSVLLADIADEDRVEIERRVTEADLAGATFYRLTEF